MNKYHKNPRSITDKQKSDLKEWIDELGDISGIVVDNNTDEIVSGNQRSDAVDIDSCVIEIVKTYDTPTIHGTLEEGYIVSESGARLNYRLVDWTPEQCEKANIIANKAGGIWDFEILSEKFEIPDLVEWGFDESEFEGFGLEPEETKGDDDVPEVQEQSETVKGDLWEVGNHRLLCGDSTMIDDVEKLMGGEKADMVFTDPPYKGKNGRGGFKDSPKLIKSKDKIMDSIESIYDFDPTNTFPILEIVKSEKISIFLFCNKTLVPDYLNYALEHDRLFDILTWHKPSCIPTNNNKYYPDTEYLIKIKDSGATFNTGLGSNVSYNKYWVMDAKQEGKNIDHPTVKPQEILKDCILICSNKKDIVLDIFLGSGSTLIACEKTNRKCYGMELDEHYVDVCVRRWVKFCKENNKEYKVKLNGNEYKGNMLEV